MATMADPLEEAVEEAEMMAVKTNDQLVGLGTVATIGMETVPRVGMAEVRTWA